MGFLDRLLGKPLDKAQFAEAMLKAMQRHGTTVTGVDLTQFRLLLGENLFAQLDNVYGQYVAAGASDRERVIEQFAAASAKVESIPTQYEEAKKKLMPVVRAASYNAMMELQMRLGGKIDAAELEGLRCVQQELVEGLVVGLAFDTEKSFTHVNEKQMQVWDVEFAQALRDALENLRERTRESEIQQEAPGVFAGRWRDSYESSRVLLTDLVYRVGAGSEPVCLIPTRDDFWVVGRGDSLAIQGLVRSSEEKHFAAYGLSPAPLLLVDGRWEIFKGDDDASRKMIRAMRLKRGAMEYAQQKQLLDAVNVRDGNETFVATCLVAQETATTAIDTLSVWSKGISTSLPVTERVVLMINPATKDHISLSWDVVRRELGGLMQEEPGMLPARYYVDAFPDDGQVETLRGIASGMQ